MTASSPWRSWNSRPWEVRAYSPHVTGIVRGTTLDGRTFSFPVRSMIHIMLAARGAWRVRQFGPDCWEEHGPTGSWVELPVGDLDGSRLFRLSWQWGWRAVDVLPKRRAIADAASRPTIPGARTAISEAVQAAEVALPQQSSVQAGPRVG